jgi:DNA repair photolyase
LKAISELAKAGVPAGVMVAPIIPGLNDHEIPAILAAAAKAGAAFAGYTILRLPYGVKGLFEEWLSLNRPGLKDKVLSQIRAMRGGALNDSKFGSRFRGEGPFALHIKGLFSLGLKKAGISFHAHTISTAAFKRPHGPKLQLFGG